MKGEGSARVNYSERRSVSGVSSAVRHRLRTNLSNVPINGRACKWTIMTIMTAAKAVCTLYKSSIYRQFAQPARATCHAAKRHSVCVWLCWFTGR